MGNMGPKIPALSEHVTYVTHVTGILRLIFLKSKCMSRRSHGSNNPKLSCTLCHIYECHACHTCHACHRDLVLEFFDKNTKTMSQVHVRHACHICHFFALSWAISKHVEQKYVLASPLKRILWNKDSDSGSTGFVFESICAKLVLNDFWCNQCFLMFFSAFLVLFCAFLTPFCAF